MAEIIKFRPREHKDKPNRLEALVKGRIRVFTCGGCGGDFEVYFDEKPKECPLCGSEIGQWNEENE